MGSAKGSGQSKDYYGHCAGVVCQGQLDFVSGLLLNNALVWPDAKMWDVTIYKKGRTVIYTNGSVYQASAKTKVDPNAFPWVFFADPWTAGTYVVGTRKLYLGNVWIVVGSSATVAPPAVAPDPKLSIQFPTITNHWQYVCTPDTWSAGTNFWATNSIVAWKGRLWTNSAGTKIEPPGAPWTLWKVDRSANHLKFTVPDNGDVFLYWGTNNQVLDTGDEKILSQNGHPPYRNKAVLMVKNFLFGTMQSSPPDLVLLGGRSPVQTLITGSATDMDADWQVNPWVVLAEILTHPVIGLGLPDSFFDATTWQAEADRCAAKPELYYISPLYTSLKKVREFVVDLMGYPDAFVFWSNVATLKAGHWPHGDAPPTFDGTNTVDRNALTEELKWDSRGWGDTANSVELSFEDVQAGFKARPVFANNLFNASVVKRMQSKKIDRPHITRFAQATAWAAEFAKIEGDQKLSGEQTIRAEKATAAVPGSLFLLTDDVLGLSQVQRCLRRTIAAAPAGVVKLAHETERGVAPQPYAPTDQNPVAANGPPPAIVTNFAVVQLPAQLGEASSISVLAARTNDVTTALDVYFKQADSNTFQLLGANHAFAVPGTFDIDVNTPTSIGGTPDYNHDDIGAVTQGNDYALTQTDFWKTIVIWSSSPAMTSPTTATEGTDYTTDATVGTISIVAGGGIATGKYVRVTMFNMVAVRYDAVTPQSDLDSVLASLTQDEINNGQCMLFAFQKANPALFEIMSIKSVQSVGAGANGPVLFASVRRAQFGTLFGGDGTHVWGSNVNDVVFMIRREGLVTLQHAAFSGYQLQNATINLRLAPESAWVLADPADLYDPATNPEGLTTAFDYTWNNTYGPTVTWTLAQVNGADVADFNTAIAHTDVINLGFSLRDTNADLVHGALIATQGQQELTVWASNFPPSDFQAKNIVFSLPQGTWTLFMNMLDLAGNQTKDQLALSAAPQIIYVDTGTTESPLIYAYNTMNPYIVQLLFGLHPGVAAGFQLYWQITARNVAWSGGAWVAAAVYGVAIGGKYRWGNATGASPASLPPIHKGSSGQTLWAYCTQTGKSDSPVLKFNF